jgi:hypothetical protein
MSHTKQITHLPSQPHYFKQWGAGKLTECQTPVIFSSYILPGSDELLRAASTENTGKEELYVICPQYANGKGEFIDTQFTVTGKATINEGNTPEEIISNGAKREVAEETGLEIADIGRPIAYRMAGKKGGKAVSVHNFYSRISPETKPNKTTKPFTGTDDPTKKIQVLLVGQKEILLELMSKNLIPCPSGDTVKPSDPNASYICGVHLIALNDILSVFFDTRKTQLPVPNVSENKATTSAKKNPQKLVSEFA